MSETRLDVLAIGDAVVDVIAEAEDRLLAEGGLVKGSMQVLDADGATALYAKMGQARETSGGSAANTMAGSRPWAGGPARRQVADDHSARFSPRHPGARRRVRHPAQIGGAPTGRCLILVTPDASADDEHLPRRRHELDAARSTRARFAARRSSIWKPISGARPARRAAMEQAMAIAHEAGRKVAFTLSDIACIAPHRAEMIAMLDAGAIDLLFANENEICELADEADREAAIAALEDKVPLIVVTCGSEGAMAVENGRRASVPTARLGTGVVDTTGAGDLFAAGFLVGQRRAGASRKLRMGSIAAAEVISHFGARPEADLKALVAEL